MIAAVSTHFASNYHAFETLRGYWVTQIVGLLLNDPRALAAPALKMNWWQKAAMAAPMNGPTQKIH